VGVVDNISFLSCFNVSSIHVKRDFKESEEKGKNVFSSLFFISLEIKISKEQKMPSYIN
jgi:hypothetical protein